MHFLSSKHILDIQDAFADVLRSQTVKRGEHRLKQLRQLQRYELLLATFISRTNIYNLRLLAVLQLEKRMVIEEEQTVWSLKTVYYSQCDKMAQIVLRLLCHRQNIKWAGEFLNCSFQMMGMIQIVRLLELVFGLLSSSQKANQTVHFHFEIFYNCLLRMAGLVCCNQELRALLLLSSCLFYESCLSQSRNQQQRVELVQKLQLHANQIIHIDQPLDGCVSLVPQVIASILKRKQLKQQPLVLQMFKQAFKWSRNDNKFKLRYQLVFIQLMLRNSNVLESMQSKYSFISIYQQHNTINNIQTIISLNLTGLLNQDSQYVDCSHSTEQTQLHNIISKLVQSLFNQHYQSILSGYKLDGKTQSQAQIQILPLINDYGLLCDRIEQILQTIIPSIVSQLQNYVSDYRLTSSHQKQLLSCIDFARFCIRFRDHLKMELIPHIVCLFGQVAYQYPNFSSLSQFLAENLWEKLATLPLISLEKFMIRYVNSLNHNEWGRKLITYSCFLHLASNLQENYQYFSHAAASDELLNITAATHRIIISMLRQIPSQQLNFQLIYLIIKLSCGILGNRSICTLHEAYEGLNVDYLVSLIERYGLRSRQSAQLLACHRLIRRILISHLKQDSLEWQINLQDCIFSIQLYHSQLKYSQPYLAVDQFNQHCRSFSRRMQQFQRNNPQLCQQAVSLLQACRSSLCLVFD